MLTNAAYAAPSALELELAKNLAGTTHVFLHRDSIDGALYSCGLEFGTVTQDFTTQQGGITKLAGSFYLRKRKEGSPIYLLKLGLFDGLKAVAVAPANAFIRPEFGKAPVKALGTPGEKAGFTLFGGQIDDDVGAILRSIVVDRKVVIGFNRRPGQKDAISFIDLTVQETSFDGVKPVRIHSEKMVQDFSRCVDDLLSSPTETTNK